MKRITAVTMCVALLICFVFAGCSANYGMASDSAMSYDKSGEKLVYATTAAQTRMNTMAEAGSVNYKVVAPDGDYDITANMPDGSKIIRNANVRVQTTDYTASVSALERLIVENGGYVQSLNEAGGNSEYGYSARHASYVARIPADKLDSFLKQKDSIGTVISTNTWQEDVSESYYDQESRLSALQTKEKRITELLKVAATTEDVIELERELSDTIYQIELITGSLRRLDSLILFSTVNIDLSEVIKTDTVYTVPKTLGEKIQQKFKASIERLTEFGSDFLVVIVGGSPIILIIIVIIVLAVLIIRAGKKRRAARRAEKRKEKAAEKAAVSAPEKPAEDVAEKNDK